MNNLLKLENKYRQVFLKLREERDRLDKQVIAAHTKLQKVKRVLYKNGFKGNIMRDDEGNRVNTLPKTELKLCPWCGSDIGGCADEACPQESEPEKLKTVAVLGGIHGVSLIQHLESMLPEYIKENYNGDLVERDKAEKIIESLSDLLITKEADLSHKDMIIETKNVVIKQLRDALILAANRLHRLSIEPIEMAQDASEWKDEAREALKQGIK